MKGDARPALGVLVWFCLQLGCDRGHPPSDLPVQAEAGIFFGGQVQNRSEWPLVLDAARQTQGFRLEFRQPLKEPAQVSWEIVRPAIAVKRHSPPSGDPAPSTFTVTVPVGTERFDQLIPFSDTDRPGEWKLHVIVNGANVLSKSITVVAKATIISDDS
jgi:hypothetical protein